MLMPLPLLIRSIALLCVVWFLAAPSASHAQSLSLLPASVVHVGYQWFAAPPVAPGTTPEVFALEAPFPNPFRGEAAVRFSLAEAATVRLEAFDALGRRVAILAEGPRPAGQHTARFDGSALAPGLYLVRLTASGSSGERTATRRVLRVP